MTCRSSKELILDLARGAAVPHVARRVVEEHIAGCAECAADFERQKELTAGLQALAREAQRWSAPPAVEQRLLAALAAREGEALSAHVARGTVWWKPALAAAAVLTLALWGLSRVQRVQEPESFRLKAEATRVPPSGSASEPRIGEARVPDPAIREPRSPDPRSAIPRSAKPQARESRGEVTPRGEVTAVEFVRIPSAIGLPEMESGTVLRMELPLTALPEYGLDIAPDAVRTSVEADVLVGQDGQPRAIRLVGTPEPAAQDSRSRR